MIGSKNINAIGLNIVVLRDEINDTLEGMDIIIPDNAKIKPSSGTVMSIGSKVTEPFIEIGKRVFWNKNLGYEYELESEEIIVVLAENQILYGS
jgi:co-chaperonin GroES (HSP10)